jgi:dTDP-4-dehydrorhamnose 3,5-epimerase
MQSMSKHFKFFSTKLKGLQIIQRTLIKDDRGFFSRFYCEEDYKYLGFLDSPKQMNHSFTKKKGTIRGMHFQKFPHEETKIISCIRGSIFDVAVDIRKNSPTFLHWHGEVLSEKENSSLYIPKGFAHGFQTLEDDCELLYIHSEFYSRDAEDSLNAHDPKIGIIWPLEASQMSERDLNSKLINETNKDFLP